MNTRAPKRTIPSMFLKKNEMEENTDKQLRRSPRNLPPALKEKEAAKSTAERQPNVEKLPAITFKGRIKYVNTFADCAMTCDDLLQRVEKHQDEIVPIGFDLEWPFSFQTGSGKTALAQICLDDKTCYLMHIYDIKVLPTAFIVLLSHQKVKLVGVNVKNDVWKLGRDFKEFPAQKVVENNCLDCGVFANRTLNRSCRWSMANLTVYLLNKQISKSNEVRRSKWHVQPLSAEQKMYAATDAYVSLLLYKIVREKADRIALEELDSNNLAS